MKIYCKISGIEVEVGKFFKEEPIFPDVHPIFRLPARSLLAKAGKYGRGVYSNEEEKLLFLALLNSTELVSWSVPADPSIPIVKQYLEAVFHLTRWIVEVDPGTINLPKYRVSNENPGLQNISTWLIALQSCKQEASSSSPALRRLRDDLMEKREYTLHKLIHSGKREELLAPKLAAWALDAADVKGEDKRREWFELMTLSRDMDVFAADLDELKDLQAHMIATLYSPEAIGKGAGSIYSGKVLELVARLVRTREGGRLGTLREEVGGAKGTFFFKGEERNLITLSENEKLEYLEEIEEELSTPLEAPPKKEDYKGRLTDWIKDNAAWVLRSSKKEYLQQAKENLGYE